MDLIRWWRRSALESIIRLLQGRDGGEHEVAVTGWIIGSEQRGLRLAILLHCLERGLDLSQHLIMAVAHNMKLNSNLTVLVRGGDERLRPGC